MTGIPENAESPAADVCEWFALCTRPATTYRLVPPLGAVPICTECNEKMDRIDG